MAMESHIITREKDLMIDMLLNGNTIKDIANACHVSRPTIYSWKSEEIIKAEIERRREQLKKTAQSKIISKVSDCIDNMYAMAMQKTDQRVRFQANKFIIEQALGKATTSAGEDNKNANDLKQELDDIKMRVVK